MAFNITIKKDGGISQSEWILFVNNDNSFIWMENLPVDKVYNTNGINISPNRFALWFSNLQNPMADLGFDLNSSGEITFGLGEDCFLLQKIIDVAKQLGGYVEADDGTILNEVADANKIDFGE